MHPMLAHLLCKWDQLEPGIGAEVAQTIGLGNMDRDDWEIQDGMPVFPYSVDEQFQVALTTIERHFLAREEKRLVREGPWLVRLGFSKPRAKLSGNEQAWLANSTVEAHTLLRQIQAMGHWNASTGQVAGA